MIRNVVLGRLRAAPNAATAAQDRAQVTDAIAAILALELPGLISRHGGWDAGLREGGWDFAITNDWEDAPSYRGYDGDAEHIKHRHAIAAVCEQLARVQFEIATAPHADARRS